MSPPPGHLKSPVAKMAVANYSSFLIAVFLSLIVSPIIVRGLGDARYGTWNLIAQVTGYYGLLDLGVRTAVGYFVARCLGSRSHGNLGRYTATGFLALAAVGALILLLGVILGKLFPVLFQTEGVAPDEIRRVVLLLSLTLAFTLPLDVFAAALNGARRAYMLAPAEIVSRIVTSIATAIAVTRGEGLVALAVIQLGGRILVWSYSGFVAWRMVPGFSVDPRMMGRGELRDLAGYGSRNLVLNLALIVINRVDLVVIGAFLNVKLVAVYAIGQMFVSYASTAVSTLTRSFTTQFTHLHSTGDEAGLRHSYLQGLRLSALVGLLLTAYLLAFGTHFIRLWLEPKYASGPWNLRSDVVMAVLALGEVSRFVQSISWQVLIGTGRQRMLMRLQLLEAGLNIGLSLVLVRLLGIPGVALGSALPLWLTNLVLLPPHIRREVGLSVGDYWKLGLRGPLLTAGAAGAASAILVLSLPPRTWTTFLVEATIAALIGASLGWRLVLLPAERQRVADLLRRLTLRLTRPGRE